ncbi:MAG: hypothetical protein A3I77_04505 [Gammaproteobacteria bacterium RIFCSPLOWO2_02_FULL_42_14]|nr:MAG: hypothetical protein A3B71_05805 [Gammaproteobacteria bacterium RIFCSPHIGHO2_02_FULL_42_43]OGT28834.1 MAG: hypothetical protein A2624_03530 [Gammaproteobacteria bacterium RIFCSPHIGHO2_01_FULL_42_8]OGT51504.1 MAG: hypothetical protein A3E54_05570 [Gammaproteobacteria bacterium RIFCSPHIGHO2_12_FULL_41_25]OGT62205.1 MAG: hypothetical protein A3I77_04505 [Gammaproteobacteria bacterium RIFCSPLOWO2_02_FULL_42_14]OGT85878.1 MAG: hypothetical protein A3G86_04195 [Gammaproteobacteria bacterium R
MIVRAIPATMSRLLQWQWVAVGVITALALAMFGHIVARSVLFGGLLAAIPTGVSAFYFFTRKQQCRPKAILWSCYWSELIKLLVMVVLAVLLLRSGAILLAPLLTGFLSAYAAYFFPMSMRKMANGG